MNKFVRCSQIEYIFKNLIFALNASSEISFKTKAQKRSLELLFKKARTFRLVICTEYSE